MVDLERQNQLWAVVLDRTDRGIDLVELHLTGDKIALASHGTERS